MGNCCCENILDMGCISQCEGITIAYPELESTTVGIHNAGREWMEEIEVVGGVATVTKFNESGEHIVKLSNFIAIEDVVYTCIRVNVVFQVQY